MPKLNIYGFLIFGMILMSVAATAQVTDAKLADQYFKNQDFDKAAIYYEKLYNQTPSNFYFQRYYESLLGLSQFNDAEKLIKKQIRKQSYDLSLRIELGQLYAAQGERKKAEKEYDEVLKNLESNQGRIISVARKFVQAGENEYALATYEKGRKLIKGFYSFNYELAELYGQMKQFDKMVELYLELIDTNPGYVQTIQNALNRNFDFEENSSGIEALRKGLLKRVQKDPNNQVFSEMLIWLYLQQKDFYGALAQTRALDKRNNENGQRLLALGKLYRNNNQFDLATNAFKAVADRGESNIYFHDAKGEYLLTQKLQLESVLETEPDAWVALAKQYAEYVERFGKNEYTHDEVRQWAAIEALRLDNLPKAVDMLKELIKVPRVPKEGVAKAKIDLGDYYVLMDEVWEAALLYGQAEKMFKFDELGEIAKFKYGKIGYYTGDFEWANAQLDVLKGSTSKLIANDAMYYSLLISDNITIDTTMVPMQMFARADLYTQQKRYTKALNLLDSININYPGHSLEDDIFFLRYKIHLNAKDYSAAAKALEKIVANHSTDLLGDEALYYLGELYASYLNDEEKAKAYYKQLLVDFPGSVFVADARNRFRQLRGDQIN